jgi:hypothetical protein
MKTFLFLGVSSVVTAAVLPSLPAKIILSAFILTVVLSEAVREARASDQDESRSRGRTWPKLARLRCFGASSGQARIEKNIKIHT